MKRSIALCWIGSLLIAICLLVSGCKSGGDATGKWIGTMDMGSVAANDPAAQAAAKIPGSVTLELKKDKTFSMYMFISIDGTWTQSGSTVTLTVAKVNDVDAGKAPGGLDKPLILNINGDSMSGPIPGNQGTVSFTRDKS